MLKLRRNPGQSVTINRGETIVTVLSVDRTESGYVVHLGFESPGNEVLRTELIKAKATVIHDCCDRETERID